MINENKGKNYISPGEGGRIARRWQLTVFKRAVRGRYQAIARKQARRGQPGSRLPNATSAETVVQGTQRATAKVPSKQNTGGETKDSIGQTSSTTGSDIPKSEPISPEGTQSKKLSREKAEELFAKSVEKTMEDLTKLEEAVAGATNTKKDVKDSTRSLRISIRLMMKYMALMDKCPSPCDRIIKSQQQMQQQQQTIYNSYSSNRNHKHNNGYLQNNTTKHKKQ